MRRLFLLAVALLAIGGPMLIPSRIPPSAMDLRQWATWASAQTVIPPQDVYGFTPDSYVGFSVDPIGSFNYSDLGSMVLIWFPTTLFGTSNATTFELATLPAAIRPTADAEFVYWGLDDGSTVLARATILSTGTIRFEKAAVSGTAITPGGSWTAAGNKGVKLGTFFLYPK